MSKDWDQWTHENASRVNDQTTRSEEPEPKQPRDPDALVDITVPALPPSLNEWYAGMHWSKRKRLKDTWHRMVKVAARGAQNVTSYPVRVVVDLMFPSGATRYDADNCVAGSKLIGDALESAGILESDGCRHVSEVTLRPSRDRERDGYTRYRIYPTHD